MKWLLFVLLFAVCLQMQAQQRTESIWQTVQVPLKFNQKLSLHNDAGYRTLGISMQPRQFLFRTGLRYRFSNKTDAAAGVALFFTKTSMNKEEHEFGKEFRLWQEVQEHVQMLKYTRIVFRLRTEQRFFEPTTKRERFDAYRFRYRATVQQELNKKLQLQAGFEYMHQLEDGVNRFNQYRIQPSLLWKMNKQVQLQTMYMIVKAPNEAQTVLWMSWIYNIN